MQVPCHNCPERHPHCHSECDKYKEFTAFRQQVLEARKKEVDRVSADIEIRAKYRKEAKRKERK